MLILKPTLTLSEIFESEKPIIGVVHLLPLPGSPLYSGDFESVIERAIKDAKALEEGGVDGIIVENFMDYPFLKMPGPETVAAMAIVVREISREISIPIGVNILRNSALEAASVCLVTGCKFIRVNAYVETVATDSGVIEPAAPKLLRFLRSHSLRVGVLADIRVKHGKIIGERRLRETALDAIKRGLASAVVLTGERTGEPPSAEEISEVKSTGVKVIVGSGLRPDNVNLFKLADGAIIGSYFKKEGAPENPVALSRVKKLVTLLRQLAR